MRVLMLTTNASLQDGITRHILSVAPALNARGGVEVAVCTVMPRGEFSVALERAGVPVFTLDCPNGHACAILPRFAAVLRTFRPDVVHAHVMALMERVVLATWMRHIPVVWTVHGIADPVAHPTFKMRLEALLARIFRVRSDEVCYISQGVRAAARNPSYPVIYNPIDMDSKITRGTLRRELGVGADAKLVGTACRLADVKNPPAFTRVMCSVLQSVPTAHAVVIGSGTAELQAELAGIVAERRVADRFHFLGYRANARELVADLDCFVLTSRREGMPTSVLEAMAAQVPVAMWTGEGGLGDLAELERTEAPALLLAEQGDENGLVDRICSLWGTDGAGLRLAERAQALCRRHFSLDTVTAQLEKVYHTVA